MNNRFLLRPAMILLGVFLASLLPGRTLLAQDSIRVKANPEVDRANRVTSLEDVAAQELVNFTFEGSVHSPDGSAAKGAIVVSSAGGKAVTDADGSFRLEVRVAPEAREVQITAVGGAGGKLLASQQVSIATAMGPVSVPGLQLAQSNGCTSSWLPTFGPKPGANDIVYALTTFDDGNGVALYVGGQFTIVGGTVANRIAKWDGSKWSILGGGTNGTVRALTVFDDGSGPALYAGGSFTLAGGVLARRVAKWDGSNWTGLALGMNNAVRALTVFDDGTGAALYAGGNFTIADASVATSKVAKWDGSSWTPLGSGMDFTVLALTSFDDGNGARLVAGGDFTTAGGSGANHIAQWDGTNWLTLGSGMSQTVRALKVFDDGSGERLVAGGDFGTAGGVPASRIAQWDGSSWASLTADLTSESVFVLATYNDGNGERLIAGGSLFGAFGVGARNIAEWDGSSWATLGIGTGGSVYAVAAFDDGGGVDLCAGGSFPGAGGVPSDGLAQWDGSLWAPLAPGFNQGVRDLLVFDDGNGDQLYAGGVFRTAGGVAANRIAKWDGTSWAPLGAGMNQEVYSLIKFDDGNGGKLIAAGRFDTAGGVEAKRIAQWDGTSWAPLGSGIGSVPLVSVLSLAVFDDGNGAALYAGGGFSTAGGLAANGIAKWDGSNWAALGSGVSSGLVWSMSSFDDGNGERLFVGGSFPSMNGMLVNNIATWDGSNWAQLGSGMDSSVTELTVFDDGNGERLFAGGSFTLANGVAANRVARWDGLSWSPLGSGVDSTVIVLKGFDDGHGARLFAGGYFLTAGGMAANRIAMWDGANWSAVGSGMSGVNTYVGAMEIFDDGTGPALFVGCSINTTIDPDISAIDSGDSYLAKWGCPHFEYEDLCNGDGGNQMGCTNCPCSNNSAPGTIGGCLNSAQTSSRLLASGDPSVSLLPGDTNDLRFELTGAPPSAFCILKSGDAVGPANAVNPCFGLNSGVQAMQYDGLRCAILNTRRHGGRSADVNGTVGSTNFPWGGEGGPPAGLAVAGAGFVAGQTRYFQVINREDPLAQCMRGFNSSQAITVTFAP